MHNKRDPTFMRRKPKGTCKGSGRYGCFPKLGGTFLGVPIIRIIVFWGLYWVRLFWETAICRDIMTARQSEVLHLLCQAFEPQWSHYRTIQFIQMAPHS